MAQSLSGLADQAGVDSICDGRNKDIRFLHRLYEFGLSHRRVTVTKTDVEQFLQARFDGVRQTSRDDNTQTF